MKTKCLILGSEGQLGQSLNKVAEQYREEMIFTFLSRSDVDLCDPSTYKKIVNEHFDVLINAAAYTAVDKAESEPKQVFLINSEAPGKLAHICKQKGALLIHISSDYVYNSLIDNAHKELDETLPEGVYAKSKLDGEQAIKKITCNYLIIRTSWVYSSLGNNFVKTMLRLSESNSSIAVVSDQTGSPTYAPDLAEAIFIMVLYFKRNHESKIGETFNFCNSGFTSWSEFAKEIFKIMNSPTEVLPINSENFGAPAYRPLNSRMDTTKFQRWFGYKPRNWQDALKECLDNLVSV